jgi:hypothetical protein
MSSFQLEVNGLCNNGATVIAVYKELTEGVVLARWNWEYVTWVFPTDNQSSTSHGNYYDTEKSLRLKRLLSKKRTLTSLNVSSGVTASSMGLGAARLPYLFDTSYVSSRKLDRVGVVGFVGAVAI